MKPKMIGAFMECAEVFARLSTANRLKVGSIIVKDDRVVSIGFNGTPPGWPSNNCEGVDGKTLPEVIHAEMNSISKLARSSESGKGATMFVTHSPCMSCAKAIYSAGIVQVYYKTPYKDLSGVDFLQKCGITVAQFELALQ